VLVPVGTLPSDRPAGGGLVRDPDIPASDPRRPSDS